MEPGYPGTIGTGIHLGFMEANWQVLSLTAFIVGLEPWQKQVWSLGPWAQSWSLALAQNESLGVSSAEAALKMRSKETSLVLGFTVKISSSFLRSCFPKKKKSSSQIGAIWFLEKMYHGISVNFPSR